MWEPSGCVILKAGLGEISLLGRAGGAGSAAPDHLEAGKKRGRERRLNRRPEVGSHQDAVVGGLWEAQRIKGFRVGGVSWVRSCGAAKVRTEKYPSSGTQRWLAALTGAVPGQVG